MNRMNWITYLKVLFDQLESFNQNKQKHVENHNFLTGLQKIKNLLPLMNKNEYYKSCSDVSFTYKDVEFGIMHMPKFITWDNVIDVFLTKQVKTSIVNQNMKTTVKEYQLESQDLYEGGNYRGNNSSLQSSVNYQEGEVGESFKQELASTTKKISTNQKKNEDFFLSFADSVIKMQPSHPGSHPHEYQVQSNFGAPLLLGNPGIADKEDDDEACEIDSDESSDN